MNLENSSTAVIVAYPYGLNLGTTGNSSAWNAGACCLPATSLESNDVKFISRLIDSIENQFMVDKSRVWAVGFSNGGMMAYRLACEIPDQITGIAVGAGAVTVETCAPSRAVNVIHLHGEQDLKVPLIGGGPYGVMSAESSLAQLANANLCVKSEANPGESLFKRNCPTSEVMELIFSPNGHDWGGDWSQRMIDFLQLNPRK
jgi:polyhydroxybutyrate depolymerase